MMIDLSPEEIHSLRYALIIAIADLPTDSETRQILQRVLEKLPAFVDTDTGEKN